jgi:NADPH-dependent ferric siderophore reductase
MMSKPESGKHEVRTRREPPAFRLVAVRRVQQLTRYMTRVTVQGTDLEGFSVEKPAASVRLLLPPSGESELTMPEWNGNEFLLLDGQRPIIRTLTPRRVRPESLELDLEIVIHGAGAASEWARSARSGAPAAVSGPGRGYAIDPAAPAFLLAGDETAIPAISQLLETLPVETPVQVYIEVAHSDARLPLPDHPRARVEWLDLPAGSSPGDALVASVGGAELAPEIRIWAAGEAASMQRIRVHFRELGLPRNRATVRGYWKRGRRGDAGDA